MIMIIMMVVMTMLMMMMIMVTMMMMVMMMVLMMMVRSAVRAVRSGTTIVLDAVVAYCPFGPRVSPRALRRHSRCPSTPALTGAGDIGLARSSGPQLGGALVVAGLPRS